jgi:hypothetical protein
MDQPSPVIAGLTGLTRNPWRQEARRACRDGSRVEPGMTAVGKNRRLLALMHEIDHNGLKPLLDPLRKR